jgi:flagellar biosynthesis/type III secretory pathway protein FliH
MIRYTAKMERSIVEAQREGYEQGYKEGLEAGIAKGRAEVYRAWYADWDRRRRDQTVAGRYSERDPFY